MLSKNSLLVFFTMSWYSCCLAQQPVQVAPGVWKLTMGKPDPFSPVEYAPAQPLLKAMSETLSSSRFPLDTSKISIALKGHGCKVELPLDAKENIYGFGLQDKSFQQRGLRKHLITNSWSIGNVGFSHAPVPFYVSSNGYGVLINTARYPVFYCGTHFKIRDVEQLAEDSINTPGVSILDLYKPLEKSSEYMAIDIPESEGIEVYIFEGPTVRDVVSRYNLFSGGGAIPPLWGLGIKYRGMTAFTEQESYSIAAYFRDNNIPCDMYGLESGWQTVAYSCSYVWNKDRFANPDSFITKMQSLHYRLNLWEHAYVYPSSPIFNSLKKYSGNYLVWKGLVPDFTLQETRSIFGSYHKTNFIDRGISAFKLDECDNANYAEANASWGIPEISEFPSGIDGERYHQLFGQLYVKTLFDVYHQNDKRTLLDVRSMGALASSYPAVLYSDMYKHADFVRMILNAGFSGLQWSPEIREAHSESELIKRIQTGIMSSQILINAWYLKHPPWLQYDYDKNIAGEFLPRAKQVEETVRGLFRLRMSLIPYLYNAYAEYHLKGTPPFRALVVDYADDANVHVIDDEYLIGESLLAAPFIDTVNVRKVYLPEGNWIDFNSHKRYAGKTWTTIKYNSDQLPLFVKEGTILPLAEPVNFIDNKTPLKITCHVFGSKPSSAKLFEDNSDNFGYERGVFNRINLIWDGKKGKVKKEGTYNGTLYTIVAWKQIAID
jgi:alpha-D-xyloside xylohydrolase